MKKSPAAIITLILIVALSASASLAKPVFCQDYPSPPSDPNTLWQPPYEAGAAIEPQVQIEVYSQTWTDLQIPTPSSVSPDTPGSIINTYLVNNQGEIVHSLYRNSTCYLISSFNGAGYFYLWEYYPSGYHLNGHWLCYRWYCPHAGIWRIGPFTPELLDPAGSYIWKLWFLSGITWSTRTLGFNFTGNYYPPDIPGLAPAPVIKSFSADKPDIEAGETVVLTWSTEGANSVTISPDIGGVALSGSTSVTPKTTTTYTLVAQGRGNSVTLSTTITVRPHIAPAIGSSAASINKWQSASLSWNAPGAMNVSISEVGNVASAGTMQVSPDRTTTYTITAAYLDGTQQSTSVTVNVKQYIWLLWVLIGLIAAAAVGVAALLIWKRARKRQGRATNIGANYGTPSEITDYNNALPPTTPLIEAVPAKLVMPDGREILLAGNARSLGRHDFENFMPQDETAYISRQHLNITYENGQYFIEDNSSTNGTLLNNNNIKGSGRLALSDGDLIELAGKLRINFKQNTDKEVQ